MPTDKPKILITITEEMNQKINELVMSDDWHMNKSQTVRYAMEQFLESQGYNLTEKIPKRGTYERG